MEKTTNTETVSFLKKNAADLPVHEPLVITQNGIPKYVVESFAERQQRDEAIATMKLISFAKQDVAKGRVTALSGLKSRIQKRKLSITETDSNDSKKDS